MRPDAMEVRRLRDGLWRWTAPHPEWKPDRGGPDGWGRMVGCLYRETAEGIVLFDPQVPPEGTEDAARFWRALDRDVARVGERVMIFVGNVRHWRSTRIVHERYAGDPGCAVHAHEVVMGRFMPDAPSQDLPAGIEVFPIAGLDDPERAYWLPDHRALVFSDAIVGTDDGGVRLVAPGRAGCHDRIGLADSLRRLLSLSPEMLLVSHGSPVLSDGSQALRSAVDA